MEEVRTAREFELELWRYAPIPRAHVHEHVGTPLLGVTGERARLRLRKGPRATVLARALAAVARGPLHVPVAIDIDTAGIEPPLLAAASAHLGEATSGRHLHRHEFDDDMT